MSLYKGPGERSGFRIPDIVTDPVDGGSTAGQKFSGALHPSRCDELPIIYAMRIQAALHSTRPQSQLL